MAQCYNSFAESSVLTDALISPIIQLCDLATRISDHFSYDDIENSDIKGELMIKVSLGGFRGELMRITGSFSESSLVAQNSRLAL